MKFTNASRQTDISFAEFHIQRFCILATPTCTEGYLKSVIYETGNWRTLFLLDADEAVHSRSTAQWARSSSISDNIWLWCINDSYFSSFCFISETSGESVIWRDTDFNNFVEILMFHAPRSAQTANIEQEGYRMVTSGYRITAAANFPFYYRMILYFRLFIFQKLGVNGIRETQTNIYMSNGI